MHRSHLAVVLPFVLSHALPLAAQGGNGLDVRSDPENVVASSLIGEWRLDAALQQRLGGPRGFGERLVFCADAAVLAKVPQQLAERLRDWPIFVAGTMTRGDEENASAAATRSGTPSRTC